VFRVFRTGGGGSITPQGRPSPVKGEGVFLAFYDFIIFKQYKRRADGYAIFRRGFNIRIFSKFVEGFIIQLSYIVMEIEET
jgi:hypothetical protein